MKESFSPESNNPDWFKWPANKTVGKCKIRIADFGSDRTGGIALEAEPESVDRDVGAGICCVLTRDGISQLSVRPATRAYWSSRRRGKYVAAYFYKNYPKLAVAVLQELDTLGRGHSAPRPERVVAVLHFLITSNRIGLDLRDSDNFPALMGDDARFKEVAECWLLLQQSTSKGSRMIASARKHVDKAKEWFDSLKSSDALFADQDSETRTKRNQSATYAAVRLAVTRQRGIPLLSQVREAFHDIVDKWEREVAENRPVIKDQNDLKRFQQLISNQSEKPGIRLEAFDEAIKDLGFSWLPRSWPQSTDIDPSD